MSRQIASQLERELGAPVNVVNATGGGGVTGHTRGALARPDGYTVTMITAELNMLHWRGLTEITWRDFEPVMLLNRDSPAIFVQNDAPWKTIGELQQAIEDDPGELKASGTAHGGTWHIGMAVWLTDVGLDVEEVNWISINGAAPSLQELVAGGVDVVCCSVPEARSLISSDDPELRCLGVMTEERLDAFPDVPTFREQGVDVVVSGWRGLGLPKGVPDDRTRKLTAAFERIIESDEYKSFMDNAGFVQSVEPKPEFERSLDRMDAQFGEVLKSDAFQSTHRNPIGPTTFPAVLAGLFVLALAGIWIAGRTESTAEIAVDARLEPRHPSPETRHPTLGLVRCAEVALAVVVYMFAAETVGFVITTAVLLTFLLWRFGTRLPTAILIGVLFAPAAWQLFAVTLRVPLPRGWFGW